MKITILVKPGAKEEKVEKCEIVALGAMTRHSTGNCLKVHVKEPAKEGRANWAVERLLAAYFKVPPSRVRIISGQTSRKKIVEIL
jgi:hypothetical protein